MSISYIVSEGLVEYEELVVIGEIFFFILVFLMIKFILCVFWLKCNNFIYGKFSYWII